jgi:uncharacterized membrane protein
VDTPSRPNRHWDVAPLLLVGVVLGMLGSRAESGTGALVSLAGFVLLLVGLARWARRPRQGRTVQTSVGVLADR